MRVFFLSCCSSQLIVFDVSYVRLHGLSVAAATVMLLLSHSGL